LFLISRIELFNGLYACLGRSNEVIEISERLRAEMNCESNRKDKHTYQSSREGHHHQGQDDYQFKSQINNARDRPQILRSESVPLCIVEIE
jgi:hypothetical protein